MSYELKVISEGHDDFIVQKELNAFCLSLLTFHY